MVRIAKTEETVKLEENIYSHTSSTGTFGCFEVTIGFRGNERVDYITYDTKGIWRCYEIKVSKSDFYSEAKKSFVGHYNYYVMPKDLFEEVKHDIPDHVGVIANGNWSVKKAKRQELKINEQILKDSLIRSLYREAQKLYKSNNPRFVENMNRRISILEKDRDRWRDKYYKIMNIGYEKYGYRWYKEDE